MEMKNVLVLGGGIAGIEAAIFLRKKGHSVTMISNRDYLYIYPTSIWIPTGEASFEDICIPLKELADVHGFELIIDEVQEIHSKERRVVCANGEYGCEYLVIAIGSGKMKHEGREHFLSICGQPEEAVKLKERLDALIRVRDKFELTFLAPMEKPGARLGEQALKMMDIFFKRLKIQRHLGKKIKRFEADGIVFEDETKLESDLTMFIPAGHGHPVFQNSDLPLNEAGLIKINDYCEVVHDYDATPEHCRVFAIGDSVALQGPDWRAKQGHVAEVMARNVAFNIDAIAKGSEERRGYMKHINILCIMDSGDGAAFVYRDDKGGKMIPMPVVGHWVKKAWGWYYRNSKLDKIPRIPGL